MGGANVERILAGERGFTLVELIITAALIGVLATLAITQFAFYRQKGYNSAAVSDLKNAKTVLAAYFADNMRYPE